MFPPASGHSTFFPDEFAHYYSEPAIHQDPIVMNQDHHITFCGTLPDKTRSGSFYGTARRYHWFAVTLPSFSYAQCHLSPDKAGNRADPLCRSIRCLCLSVSSASAGHETHKTAVHDHSVNQPL